MSKLVVVVDSDDAVIRMLVRCLEPLKCSVKTFRDGQEALKFLEKNAGRVHLLISERTLPGLSGEDLARRFQKMNPAAPVLLISGDYVEEGTIPIMEKPFSIKGFQAKVRQLLAVQS